MIVIIKIADFVRSNILVRSSITSTTKLLGEKIMRKVLLASTALFALGSVSAMAADITISGGFELGYDSEADQSDGTRSLLKQIGT